MMVAFRDFSDPSRIIIISSAYCDIIYSFIFMAMITLLSFIFLTVIQHIAKNEIEKKGLLVRIFSLI